MTDLSRPKIKILSHLATLGATPAWVFDEYQLDALFKMRPRLIDLVPGNDDPVITITPLGQAALTAAAVVERPS
jgi:hypothetical protein